MLDPKRIQDRALRRLVERGDASRINPQWLPRIRRILAALNIAMHPAELDTPGNHFHELKGDRKGTYTVRVSANWRITFRWDDDGPLAVNLEDYHGN